MAETRLSGYGSIYSLGHIAVSDIFESECEITEKVDGSQLSFSMLDGELLIRSKNQQLHFGADNGMFNKAIEVIDRQYKATVFQENWIYRGEYLVKPRHNTLSYSRIPNNHIMIYDIEKGPGTADFLRWEDRNAEALRIGFEPVPVLAFGTFVPGPEGTLEAIKSLLETESVLGGVKIEGVVIKNYSRFSEDKKVMKAKYVNPEFQEKQSKEWKKENPGRKDIITQLIETYAVPARWMKSVQHLRDDGRLEGSPRDIGNLIKEAQEDLKKEEEDAIKEILYKHFLPQILRGSTSGLPIWYKEKLAEGEINGLAGS